MEKRQPEFQREGPVEYQIQVLGRLTKRWSGWFDGMDISAELQNDRTVTTMTGVIVDQAALFGLLNRIRDLSLPLLLVRRIQSEMSKANHNLREKTK
ncbi:MAG: hypothetical protein GY832_05005 [Chloroflexi bacterium]|nr:hypothetical protein [Chloroflexota bacterium]